MKMKMKINIYNLNQCMIPISFELHRATESKCNECVAGLLYLFLYVCEVGVTDSMHFITVLKY